MLTVDLEKTFDFVSWSFLDMVIIHMNFPVFEESRSSAFFHHQDPPSSLMVLSQKIQYSERSETRRFALCFPYHIKNWKDMMDIFEARLSKWKA